MYAVGLGGMDGKRRYGCCAVDKLDELMPSHVKPTVPRIDIVQARTTAQEEAVSGRPMPALGHVWTAPWQELSDLIQHGRVRSRSGLLMRRGWPLALMLS